MFFTKININQNSAGGIRILTDQQEMHRFVMSGFPDVGSESARKELGVLYTQLMSNSTITILVQSKDEPDISRYQKVSYVNSVKTMSITDLLNNRIVKDKIVKFKTTVNPAKTVNSESGVCRRLITKREELTEWLAERLDGCELIGWERTNRDIATVNRQGKQFTLYKDTIEGAVKITDPQAFKDVISTGLGKSKAYGCGLVLVS